MATFEGKVAIVTGSTTVESGGLNIGGATATELAAGWGQGRTRRHQYRRRTGPSPFKLNERRGQEVAIAVETDVRSEDQIERLVATTVERLCAPSIVINIVGIFPAADGDVATIDCKELGTTSSRSTSAESCC